MKFFLFGVFVSSFIWFGILYAQSRGMVTLFKMPEETTVSEETVVAATDVDTETAKPEVVKKRMKKRRRPRQKANAPIQPDLGYEEGEGQTGDDLTAGPRSISPGDAGGDEGQLSNAEIESAIDQRFNGIQRCLTLMPPDAPGIGRLVIGMNISGAGTVTRVNLRGPNAMIKGEPGACFRRIVSAMRFRRFNGPDMIVHYPIIFE
jgi:hypothetical protein